MTDSLKFSLGHGHICWKLSWEKKISTGSSSKHPMDARGYGCQGFPFLRVPFFRNGTRVKIGFFYFKAQWDVHKPSCCLFGECYYGFRVSWNPEPEVVNLICVPILEDETQSEPRLGSRKRNQKLTPLLGCIDINTRERFFNSCGSARNQPLYCLFLNNMFYLVIVISLILSQAVHLFLSTIIHSDEWWAYRALQQNSDYYHFTINHSHLIFLIEILTCTPRIIENA